MIKSIRVSRGIRDRVHAEKADRTIGAFAAMLLQQGLSTTDPRVISHPWVRLYQGTPTTSIGIDESVWAAVKHGARSYGVSVTTFATALIGQELDPVPLEYLDARPRTKQADGMRKYFLPDALRQRVAEVAVAHGISREQIVSWTLALAQQDEAWKGWTAVLSNIALGPTSGPIRTIRIDNTYDLLIQTVAAQFYNGVRRHALIALVSIGLDYLPTPRLVEERVHTVRVGQRTYQRICAYIIRARREGIVLTPRHVIETAIDTHVDRADSTENERGMDAP